METKTKNVLLVDDEPKILEILSAVLENQGFRVFTAETGEQALQIFERENLKLILLDLMLPDISGEELCAVIRKKSRVPVIMLTAKAGEEDVLKGLHTGADDYVTKPFSLKILRARVDAVLRRSADEHAPLFSKAKWNGGDLRVDVIGHTVFKAGKEVRLTLSEYNLLAAFIRYPDKVFTRDELIMVAFGKDFDGYDRAIDSHIKNLRQKIESNPKEPEYVLTVHGVGYKFGGGQN